MDLIDREQAMNIFAVDLAEKDRQVSYQGFCIDAAMAIGSLPSAEKTGKWKPFDLTWGRRVYFCTACNNASEVPTSMGEPVYRFCPWCGARMED